MNKMTVGCCIIVLLFATACDLHDSDKIVVVFVDQSASVTDIDPYRAAWEKIVNGLRAGDRIVVASITDRTYTRFQPLVDQELPKFNWFSDNSLTYSHKTETIRAELRHAVDTLFLDKRTPKTELLDSIDLAAKIFHNDVRRPVLVLISDMLEDSEVANFESRAISERLASHLVEQRRRHNDLPDLHGAEVYVAGASATNSLKAREVERFWVEYIKCANGKLSPEHYGPALFGFNE